MIHQSQAWPTHYEVQLQIYFSTLNQKNSPMKPRSNLLDRDVCDLQLISTLFLQNL